MIEFKADCGHTVRAKDEDAGNVVRCSYCGRRAAVPEDREDNLEFLFQDVDSSEGAPGKPPPKGSRRRLFGRRARKRQGFDPFSVVLRMCYAALLIVIVIVVVNEYILPLFKEGGRVVWAPPQPKPREPKPVIPPRPTAGLITRPSQPGLYVASTPAGAAVWALEVSKAPDHGRIRDVPGCVQGSANDGCLRVQDGTYVVEVVLASNDWRLNDPDLPNFQQYRTFRRAIERASDEERVRLMEEYFVPDEAWPVFVDQTEEQIYLVRQFRNVHVDKGRTKGIRALFLPRIVPGGRNSFSIAQLVTHYLPKEKVYKFDEGHLLSELDYYDVPKPDRLFVLEALSRIGVVPYVTPDGRTRLFKIGIDDGDPTAKVIREPSE